MTMDTFFALLGDPKVLAVLSPLVVAGMKKAVATVPKWALPLLSVVVGALASVLAGGDVATGAAAGLAGVGVREAIDQAKKIAH